MPIVKKLTTKTLIGRVDPSKIDVKTPLHLYTITGIIRGMKPGTGQYGDYVAFLGDFAAVVPGEKEVKRSSKCFLPPVVEQQVLSAFRDAKTGNANAEMEFGIKVLAKKNDTPIGFEYIVEPTMKVQESNRLAELLKAIGGRHALPDETTATVTEPAKEDGKGKGGKGK